MALAGEQVLLRPSLCPHHALIYRSRGRSYRELPLRLAELGGQYRAELSGTLGGLTRVRAMQLNDAHIFCAPHQVAEEAYAALQLIRQAYAALGLEPLRFRLSLPGPGSKYVGQAELWERAAAELTGVLEHSGLPWEAGPGEAAFYGPKIDVQVADRSEREASLSTVQVDFYQPGQFGLEYAGADGARHRPVMVHRSLVGSMERAVAQLTERHGGAFPDWLAPEQLVVLPLTSAQQAPADAVARQATGLGLRARVAAPESGTLGSRIRSARLVPYQAILGEREAAAGQVAVRLRDGRRLPALPVIRRAGRHRRPCRRTYRRAVGRRRLSAPAFRYHPGPPPRHPLLPAAAVHDLIKGPPQRVCHRCERPAVRIAEREQQGPVTVLGKAEQPAGERQVGDARMAAAHAEVGRGQRHGHGRLAEVELGPVKLVVRGGPDDHNRGRRPGHVPGAAPDSGQLPELLALGDRDEIPRLPVLRGR